MAGQNGNGRSFTVQVAARAAEAVIAAPTVVQTQPLDGRIAPVNGTVTRSSGSCGVSEGQRLTTTYYGANSSRTNNVFLQSNINTNPGMLRNDAGLVDDFEASSSWTIH
jgi:hypothetical protein